MDITFKWILWKLGFVKSRLFDLNPDVKLSKWRKIAWEWKCTHFSTASYFLKSKGLKIEEDKGE